jgi:hypothetical protein
MVGDLTTAITFNDRYSAGIENIFLFTRLALSENWLVFEQPDFVGTGAVALLIKGFHSGKTLAVFPQPQVAYYQWGCRI